MMSTQSHSRRLFTDRDEALLNALEKTWKDVPTMLCLWHILKNIKKHAREHAFRPVTNEDGQQEDTVEHESFMKAFLRVVYSKTEAEYEIARRHLHELNEEEAAYVDATWLDIWKWRIVHCYTKHITHFGLQSTSRVEGYHAAMKLWLRNSTCDLLTIHKRMMLWWADTIEKHEHADDVEATSVINAFRKNIYEGVVRYIHNYALKHCDALLQQSRSDSTHSACSGSYTKTTGLPCIHRLMRLKESGKSLEPVDFHAHWWVQRSSAPAPELPRVLQPRSIPDLRAMRARTKAEAAQKLRSVARKSKQKRTRKASTANKTRTSTNDNPDSSINGSKKSTRSQRQKGAGPTGNGLHGKFRKLMLTLLPHQVKVCITQSAYHHSVIYFSVHTDVHHVKTRRLSYPKSFNSMKDFQTFFHSYLHN